MIGAAIRKAQAFGLHRKQTYTPDSLECELWKRAFWYVPFRRFSENHLTWI